MTENKKLFLSAVSKEFLAYRQLLTSDLKRPALDVGVQAELDIHRSYRHVTQLKTSSKTDTLASTNPTHVLPPHKNKSYSKIFF